MGIDYGKAMRRESVPQSEALPGQVNNSAGGHAFPVDDWKRMERFLILGTDGPTFYATERKLTIENAAAVERCVAADGDRAVRAIAEISHSGRAPKNDPALFALAIACRKGSDATKRAAYAALPTVARIGTHLFHWASYMDSMGGLSGNGAKRAVSRWYGGKDASALALKLAKYQQRDGWSHRDLLRLAHPRSPNPQHGLLYDWATHGWPSVGEKPHDDTALGVIWAFERAKTVRGKELVKLIADYRLPHECVPNEAKNDPDVWAAMLPSMGVTALVRNLGKMTSVGVLGTLSDGEKRVVDTLGDVEALRRGRVHPIAILIALKTYAQGHGEKGKLAWQPNRRICDALDSAFYLAFKTVEPTGKRHMLAVDVSGSMDSGLIAGMPGITPRVGAAAMALVTANVEQRYAMVAYESRLSMLDISPKMRLDDVVATMQRMHMGATDCAQPMIYARENKIPVDIFVHYSDNETWAGSVHPCVALELYRQKMGIPAKLAVVGMTSNDVSIADPADAGSMDFCGFDASAPSVLADFVRS